MAPETLFDTTRRVSRSVQTLVGWIFWDPGAVRRYESLGLPGNAGYIAARCAPFAAAGFRSVSAAFGSISPVGIELTFQVLGTTERFWEFWHARNEAITEGLAAHAPNCLEALARFEEPLTAVVNELPTVGRPFFASHLALPEINNPSLRGWHAVNAIREWRGDTHWNIVAGFGLSGSEASVLHNEWLGYDENWLSLSRGNTLESIEAAWESLRERGLAQGDRLLPEGLILRQEIEDKTDEISSVIWSLLGGDATKDFITTFEPDCVALLQRVDLTAGVRYQPASRTRA